MPKGTNMISTSRMSTCTRQGISSKNLMMMDTIFEKAQLCQDPQWQSYVTPDLPESSSRKRHSPGLGEDFHHQPCSKKQRMDDDASAPRRIPCKARGMPEDHNAEHAYFEISTDINHGQILACSHPNCIASGRRFRYCGICSLPVAKRNFMKRHAHGVFASSKELMDADIKEVDIPTICSFISQAAPSVQSQMIQATGHNRVVSWDHKADPLKVIMDMEETIAVGTMKPSISEGPKLAAVHLNDNEFKWVSLLHDRPQLEDTVSMSDWMENVIKLSEDVIPLEIPFGMNNACARNPLVSPDPGYTSLVSPIMENIDFPPPIQSYRLDIDSDSTFDDIDFSQMFDF